MNNSTALNGNLTESSLNIDRNLENAKLACLIFLLLSFVLFLHLVVAILHVFFTAHHIRESARYILFSNMLFTDTLHLMMGLFLLVTMMYLIYFPVPWCIIVQILSTSTFRVTPYNLAAMALERYIAICHPLRHEELCTAQRAHGVIAVIWVIGLIPSAADLIVMTTSVNKSFFLLKILCTRAWLFVNPVQTQIRSLSLIISFTLVGLTIIYTYTRVMLVAKRIASGDSSAMKACKTILLHGAQLILCMTAFISVLTDQYVSFPFIHVVTFILFLCVPRFISPLIYGLRDEAFQKYIRKLYFLKHSEIAAL
uniref:G-protein coupled receptors family 1 profile domain-containing protein n=1 Tax=Leptobrachium leishanense TaxID=445787 RepID=A0A8C5LUJ9_9ANUR